MYKIKKEQRKIKYDGNGLLFISYAFFGILISYAVTLLTELAEISSSARMIMSFITAIFVIICTVFYIIGLVRMRIYDKGYLISLLCLILTVIVETTALIMLVKVWIQASMESGLFSTHHYPLATLAYIFMLTGAAVSVFGIYEQQKATGKLAYLQGLDQISVRLKRSFQVFLTCSIISFASMIVLRLRSSRFILVSFDDELASMITKDSLIQLLIILIFAAAVTALVSQIVMMAYYIKTGKNIHGRDVFSA